MSTATEKEMQELHAAMAKLMTKKLEEMKNLNIEDINSSFLSTVRQFLKDNHIEVASGVPNEPLAELVKEYPFSAGDPLTH